MVAPKFSSIKRLVTIILSAAVVPVAVCEETPLLERDVLPILTKNCMGCHGGLRKKGGLDLRTVPAMLAGGDSGSSIVSGDASKSMLWNRIASDEMPEGDDREREAAPGRVPGPRPVSPATHTPGQAER